MMQHDLFVNPDRRARAIYPLVVVLQADGVDSDTHIVAPLTTTAVVPNPPTRALPLVTHDDRDYVVMTQLIGVLAARQLGQPVGSIAPYRDDIARPGLAVFRNLTPWKPPDVSIAATARNWPGHGWTGTARPWCS